jgi:DNA-binding CsgD family transcriptional regulator
MADTRETRAPSPRELQALIEAERRGVPFVYWRDGAGAQHILMLEGGGARVTIGRRDQSDIALTWDAEVSRAHALLEPVGVEWTIVDDGLSRNGSYVNGSRVWGRQRLHDRDRMCFGNTVLVYRDGAGAYGSDSTARADEAAAATALTDTQRRVLIALCRPIVNAQAASPATNPQIAADIYLSVDAVKAHLRILFERFGLSDLPQNEKRSRLVSLVLSQGVLTPRDF